ncbi:MAG: hypothetical protein B7Z55_01935 [Planctomycetales bacterium 12-60-4]|nr:MAG: hypothetical protein B7Z55_01935 [Planctomycetales bacterium 12-60-4]
MQRSWTNLVLAGVAVVSLLMSSTDAEAGKKRRCCQPVASCCQPVTTCCQPVTTCCQPAPTCCQPATSAASSYEEASPVPTPPTLYERLGGAAAIKAVVDEFVGLAAADEKVNFFRKGTDKEWKPGEGDVDKLKMHLVNLIGQLTGGPEKYTGRDMKSSHAGMKITGAEFDALAADLIAALDKFKVPQAEKDELIKIVASTKADIVEVP